MASRRLRVSNNCSSFITLWLEPWGADYGLSSGDEIEIVANDPDAEFCFHISDDEKGMKVWLEGHAEEVSVQQDGRELECGHNRREETW